MIALFNFRITQGTVFPARESIPSYRSNHLCMQQCPGRFAAPSQSAAWFRSQYDFGTRLEFKTCVKFHGARELAAEIVA